MKNFIRFGEEVAGFDIPVLNEREIRAAAGILFVVIYTALVLILFRNNFLLAKYAITIFLVDFIVRVFVNPNFSPSLIIGRMIVRNQVPEYVGARQKKFAWIIGLILSATMFIFMVLINSYSPVTGIICLLCLIFLFFESAFGICLACKVYRLFYGEKAQYCPGEICAVSARQPIQKTSGMQLVIVVVFVGFVFTVAYFFGDELSKTPHNLFGTPVAKLK
ncbi:MAG: DUF4395 domain-containing protein [Williamsia sp.]|nr:DUF4395 domain-containing protein [Williamsia sp.]